MIRKIIVIDEEKCNGCGLCAAACHEGAIGILHGKAKLLREDYCDGLGDCLPACPKNAISFEEREAPAYNEAAVLAAKESAAEKSAAKSSVSGTSSAKTSAVKALASKILSAPVFAEKEKSMKAPARTPSGGCPGTISRKIQQKEDSHPGQSVPSRLQNFPVQIKLVPTCGPVFDHVHLLVAADCTAYAYGNFHQRFMQGKTTIIGCPKLDEGNYADKLTEIFRQNTILSVTLVRMQVPCCGGLTRALQTALSRSGKNIPMETYIVTPDGTILDEK